MPTYVCQTLGPNGYFGEMEVDADCVDAAEETVKASGLFVVSVKLADACDQYGDASDAGDYYNSDEEFQAQVSAVTQSRFMKSVCVALLAGIFCIVVAAMVAAAIVLP